jgi:lycopene cyclase domain-containing protein
MGKWGYVGMLAFTVVGSFWLEIAFKVRVLQRITRALRAITPIALLFLLWDALAIKHGDWFFDPKQILGIIGPFRIPLEEYFFFLVVPLAAIMTIEAVRRVKGDKPGWLIGDEE